jgi:hypothetical protein
MTAKPKTAKRRPRARSGTIRQLFPARSPVVPPIDVKTVIVEGMAAALGLGISTCWQLISAEEVSSLSVGRRRLVTVVSIDEFVKRQEKNARSSPSRRSPPPMGRALLLTHVLSEQHAMARRAVADGWPEETTATAAPPPFSNRGTSMNDMKPRSSDEDGRRLTAASEARERLNSPHIRNVINNNRRSYSDRAKVLVDIAWPATETRALVSQEDVTSIALRHLQGVPFDWVRQMTEAIAAEFARNESERLAQLEAERVAQQPQLEAPAPQPEPARVSDDTLADDQ